MRWDRLLLILGLRHLRRLSRRARRVLRRLPIPGEETGRATTPMPRELTLIPVPLVLSLPTALRMRTCLEDLVIFLEMVESRAELVVSTISESLRTR